MTAIYNSTSFSFNNQVNQPQLSNQSYNPPNMSPNFVYQNIFNTLQQIQNSNPNHSQISINDLLKTLPNINQPQFTFPQLPIAPIPQIQPQPQPIQPNPKPKKMNKNKCVIAKPKLKAIDENNEVIPSPKAKSFMFGIEQERLNVRAPEFIPSIKKQQNTTKYIRDSLFIPIHKARAKLNIYIPKPMTKKLLRNIYESFPNANALYYYLDITTALQMNDKQIYVFKSNNNSNQQIGIINFDLHLKGNNELLYFIISPNDSNRIESNKWLWKLDKYLTQKELIKQYNINVNDLPKSSRLSYNGINNQLERQYLLSTNIHISVLGNIDWNNINQIGSPKKVKKAKKTSCNCHCGLRVILNRNTFISECIKSWNSICIPIIVYENSDINNSKHWIEWIKFIYIKECNTFIGISFKYNNNNWIIGSIYLDKGDIKNKHRLVGINNNIINIKQNYNKYFDLLHTSIDELIFE